MAMTEQQENKRNKILDTAEMLFRERGFNGVSLQDLARAVGIRKPSFYHHFPGGKEELFLAVQIRMFERLGNALQLELVSIYENNDGQNVVIAGLEAAARWFLSRPPTFLLAMMHYDMPELEEHARSELVRASYGVLMEPIVELIRVAQRRGDAREMEPHIVAGAFLSILEGTIIASQAGLGGDPGLMLPYSIDLLARGIVPATGQPS